MYPFNLKIKEPELIKIYLRLEQDHIVKLPNNISQRISWQLKPIRHDVFLGSDRKYNDKYLALKPNLRFEMIPLNDKKSSYKLNFKKLL